MNLRSSTETQLQLTNAYVLILHSDLLKTSVTIKIGPEAVPIQVHKELICHHADFFKGAFDGGFAEAEKGEIWLEEEDERIFRMFVAWLYTQEIVPPTVPRPELSAVANPSVSATSQQTSNGINGVPEDAPLPTTAPAPAPATAPTNDSEDESDESEDDSGDESSDISEDDELSNSDSASASEDESDLDSSSDEEQGSVTAPKALTMKPSRDFHQLDLVDLYVLADRRQARLLKNKVCTLIYYEYRKMAQLPSTAAAITASEHLPEKSKLLKLFRDMFAYRGNCSGNSADWEKLPTTFLGPLVRKLFRLKRGNTDWMREAEDMCHYHDQLRLYYYDAEVMRCRQSTSDLWDKQSQAS